MASITTKRGDHGTTRLLFGAPVSKACPSITAAGDADELNASLGLARIHARREDIGKIISNAQHDLVGLMGMISCGQDQLSEYQQKGFRCVGLAETERLTLEAATLEAEFTGGFGGWSTPGADGQPAPAALEFARCVCRRAERSAAALGTQLPDHILPWLNRLSDLLWLCARCEERHAAT